MADAVRRSEPGRAPELEQAFVTAQRLKTAVSTALAGKDEVVERAVIAVLSRGHLLVEDVPGVGKTTLARALARALGVDHRRVQCTSDLMPSDLLGVSVYRAEQSRFEFQPGPVFTHVLLADEINRATPRTQSALLEAMNERQVTVDGTTRKLPEPFLVIATQNPDDAAGTYPLPDSQLDRFLVRTRIGYPSAEIEKALLLQRTDDAAEGISAVAPLETLLAVQRAVDQVAIEASVLEYIHAIITATRGHDRIGVGVSTRGARAFLRAACARAVVHGRGYLVPDDVSEVAVPVLAHRIRLSGGDPGIDAFMGEVRRDDAEQVIRELLDRLDVPT